MSFHIWHTFLPSSHTDTLYSLVLIRLMQGASKDKSALLEALVELMYKCSKVLNDAQSSPAAAPGLLRLILRCAAAQKGPPCPQPAHH